MVKNTRVKLDKNFFHLKTQNGTTVYYICAWYIQNISSLKLISSKSYVETDPFFLFKRSSSIDICPNPKGIKIEIKTNFNVTEFCISIASSFGKEPLKYSDETINRSIRRIYCAFIEGEDFQKLKNIPDNTAVIICRMKYISRGETKPKSHPTKNLEYMNSLKEELKQYSGTSLKEIVSLKVSGEETERVNKAILCIRSPVFAKMFETDMKELKDNTVTITDIKMPVLRVLVTFLWSGILPKCDFDFDFSCQLYYAADKYDIQALRLACIALLASEASLANLFHLLKLPLSHSDELLKSVAMILIRANIEEIILTPDWKSFMQEEPVIALEAATFFDLN